MEQKERLNPERLNPWAKNIRHAGSLWGNDVGGIFAAGYVLDETDDSDVEAGVIASAAGVIIGVLIAIGTLIYRKIESYRNEGSAQPVIPAQAGIQNKNKDEQENSWWTDNLNDPWNARVKAGVVFGEGIGRTIFSIIPPIPIIEKILIYLGGAIGGVLGGLIAYFTPASWWTKKSERPTSNPVSERVRTGGMIGSFAGIALSLLFLITPGGPLAPGVIVAVCGGLGALFGSIIALFADDSPLPRAIDAPGERASQTPPILESNPWSKRIRAGVQWGACLGILLAVLFPGFGIGLSLPVSIAIGGAIASVGGAIISVLIEPLVLKFFPTAPPSPIHGRGVGGEGVSNPPDTFTYATQNPWVPRCRAGVFWGTAWGMLIGCLLFPGFAGATAGGAIGGLVGGLVGIVSEPLYLYLRVAYQSWSQPKNPPAAQTTRVDPLLQRGYEPLQAELDKYLENSPNPWSERCRTGTMVGAAIGALIGYLLFPPLGMFYGSGIGGILGGVIAALIPSAEVEKNTGEDVGEKPDLSGTAAPPGFPKDGSNLAARPVWTAPAPGKPQEKASDQNLRREFN